MVIITKKTIKKTTNEVFKLIDNALHIVQALRSPNRRHEPKKDKYIQGMLDWNYSILSDDIEQRKLRIILTFSEQMLIVTVIVLG